MTVTTADEVTVTTTDQVTCAASLWGVHRVRYPVCCPCHSVVNAGLAPLRARVTRGDDPDEGPPERERKGGKKLVEGHHSSVMTTDNLTCPDTAW